MGRALKPPRASKLAEIEAKRMARLGDPALVAELAAKAARRLERAKRFADQAQRRAELKAKRDAKDQAKAIRDERREAKAALLAQVESRRRARLARRAAVESRRDARLNRQKAKEAKWAAAAQKASEKAEKALKLRQRKAEIADFKANRGKYLNERKRLARENPWALVLEQEELVELAYRRKLLLRQDERGAKAVMGADDPETILDWHRLKKEFQSASSSWQHEKRKLVKLTLAARAFDEKLAPEK